MLSVHITCSGCSIQWVATDVRIHSVDTEAVGAVARSKKYAELSCYFSKSTVQPCPSHPHSSPLLRHFSDAVSSGSGTGRWHLKLLIPPTMLWLWYHIITVKARDYFSCLKNPDQGSAASYCFSQTAFSFLFHYQWSVRRWTAESQPVSTLSNKSTQSGEKQPCCRSRFWTVHLCHPSRFLISWTGSLSVNYKVDERLILAVQCLSVLSATLIWDHCIINSWSERRSHLKSLTTTRTRRLVIIWH